MDKISSDEKLLKLIESSQGLPKIKQVGFKLKSRRFNFKLSSLKLRFKPTLSGLNKILFVFAVIFTIIFLYVFLKGSSKTAFEFFSLTSEALSGKRVEKKSGLGVMSLMEYAGIFKHRNIFIPPEVKIEEVEEEGNEKKLKLDDLVKNLKLVGIIWSANPEAMIEDATETRTLLLKQGDSFGKNLFKVKSVLRNSVILDVFVAGKSMEYELR